MRNRWILITGVVLASVGMMVFYLNQSKPKYKEGYDIEGFAKLPVQAGGRVQPIDSFARNNLLMMRAKQAFIEDQGGDKVRRPAVELLLESSLRMEKAESYPLFRIDHEQVLGLIHKSQADGKEFPLSEIKPHMASIQDQLMVARQKPEEKRDEYDQALGRLANGLQSYMAISGSLPMPIFTDSAHTEIEAYDGLLKAGLEAQALRDRGEPHDQAMLERLETFVKVYNNQLNDPRTSDALHSIPPILAPADPEAFVLDRDPLDKRDAEKIVDDIHKSDLPYRDKVEAAMGLAQRASSSGAARGIYQDYIDRWEAMIPWKSPVESLLSSIETGEVDPLVKAYAAMSDAFRAEDATAFNRAVEDAHEVLEKRMPHLVNLASMETRLNTSEPFLQSMILYVCAFLAGAVSWLVARQRMATAAMIVMLIALGIHAYGLYARMVIMDRPWVWVTNLYSSAVFIGFTSVMLCVVLEYFFRRGIAAACGSIIGFATLVVAHHLSLEGDTLAPLEAVLDTNFWLSTHVTTVTIGYAATFLAGFLAIFYIGYGMFRSNIPSETAKLISGMVYGIICFALLFSLIGTLLGGIWADQSWGRFWGWDPKENGALMIVLWNALILHARWGKVTGIWGIMCLAVFGNVITSWSWFGTNLLGVGLHSYGFNSSTAMFLLGFLVFNLFFIAAGIIKMLTSSGSPPKPKPHTPEGKVAIASSV